MEDDAQTPAPTGQVLSVAFTGSGSEYFRIWIVNLLLMLVTLGIYYPWAKVRRLRYLHANTLVGGAPLGYHADPRKMFKGYALVALLLVLYSLAGKFSPVAGAAAFGLLMLLWPALLKSSLRFRLANTSWRGLRLRFAGDLEGAYLALLPLFAPAFVVVLGAALVDDRNKPPPWYGLLVLATMAVTMLLLPWLLKHLKDYQHNHYVLATEQTRLHAGTGQFYALAFKMVGVYLGTLVFMGAAAFGVVALLAGAVPGLQGGPGRKAMMGIVALCMMLALVLLFFVLIKPYFNARMQNLVWGHTGSPHIQFHSTLKARALVGLSVKNWLLMVLTLGLYWPFAAIARLRLQLEAIQADCQVDLDALVNQAQSQPGGVAGDAAGDLFDLDIGF